MRLLLILLFASLTTTNCSTPYARDTNKDPNIGTSDPNIRTSELLADNTTILSDDLINKVSEGLAGSRKENKETKKTLRDIEQGLVSIDHTDADQWGFTILHRAILQYSSFQSLGRTCEWDRVVNILLNKGANPNIRDQHGRTPLEMAIEFHCVSIVGVLIAKGALLTEMTSGKQTPLECARNLYDVLRAQSWKKKAAYDILKILQKAQQK